jgi:hypothetical protein
MQMMSIKKDPKPHRATAAARIREASAAFRHHTMRPLRLPFISSSNRHDIGRHIRRLDEFRRAHFDGFPDSPPYSRAP